MMEETVGGNPGAGVNLPPEERGKENGVGARVALVTGAFSGIGLASAHALREAGFHVYATGRDITKAPPDLRRVIPGKPAITILQLDVQDAGSVRAAFASVAAASGRLDVLVNNAGYGLFGAVTSGTDEQIRNQLDTNVVGVIRTTRAALPVMMLHRRGRIINIGGGCRPRGTARNGELRCEQVRPGGTNGRPGARADAPRPEFPRDHHGARPSPDTFHGPGALRA